MLSRYVVSQVKHNSFFLVGLALGLWVSLCVVPLEEEAAVPCGAAAGAGAGAGAGAAGDEFEPRREQRPAGGGAAPGRSVQRPRYYSTELGMRGSLLTGVLSSEEALKSQIAALNHTAARLQPALKFFITASAMSSAPGLANVVGFTDTREMLKPFHALKYLADNYLEEYDFFFLVSDTTFVNARRLTELVSRLSVSQDVYMGVVADDDSHYCSLEGGILLSNSVLRAVHGQLDWCVRNSYSAHHHENLGRCVLHAARRACTPRLQGRTYASVAVRAGDDDGGGGPALTAALADAVTVRGARSPRLVYQLHAHAARAALRRGAAEARRWRGYLWRNAARHPPAYRNATWPGGLRADPGLAPPPPDSRFDHLRWISFNATHAFFPDDRHEVALVAGATREALDAVLEEARAWALRRWAEAESAQLVEGAWRWEPAAALRYRLLLRLRGGGGRARLRLVEALRPLGAARLVPVRYVTESARVWLLLPVPADAEPAETLDFLQRYETVCLEQDKNTALVLVLVGGDNATAAGAVRAAVDALRARHAAATLALVAAPAPASAAAPAAAAAPAPLVAREAARAALAAALAEVPRDALLLQLVAHAQFNQDFLNRVRMNTVRGEQWFLPAAFARYALAAHPRWAAPAAKPQTNTGRFNLHHALVLSFYRSDYDAAASSWRGAGGAGAADAARVLARAALRCVRAPEPALVLAPRGPPCAADPAGRAQCGARLREQRFEALDLGARHSLAQLLLETQADLDA